MEELQKTGSDAAQDRQMLQRTFSNTHCAFVAL